MALFGLGTGRRHRRGASAGVALLFLIPIIGYDLLCDHLQTQEAFTGTIVRKYSEKSFFSRRNSSHSRRHYWDVRGADGEVHALRIQSQHDWSGGRQGLWVVKHAGEFQPDLAGP